MVRVDGDVWVLGGHDYDPRRGDDEAFLFPLAVILADENDLAAGFADSGGALRDAGRRSLTRLARASDTRGAGPRGSLRELGKDAQFLAIRGHTASAHCEVHPHRISQNHGPRPLRGPWLG
jgi:hypothetical protein